MNSGSPYTPTLVRPMSLYALTAALIAIAPGCAVLDALDEEFVRWGLFPPETDPEIPPLSVVRLETAHQRGVGVIIDRDLIFTAAHVVAGTDRATVFVNGLYSERHHMTLRARVVYRSRGADQALLAVEPGYRFDQLADLGESRPGSGQMVLLRPGGAGFSSRSVHAASARPLDIAPNGRRFNRCCAIRRGDSGSPVVQDGKVVGLLSGPGRMVRADVLRNYRRSLSGTTEPIRRLGSRNPETEEPCAPECALPEISARGRRG